MSYINHPFYFVANPPRKKTSLTVIFTMGTSFRLWNNWYLEYCLQRLLKQGSYNFAVLRYLYKYLLAVIMNLYAPPLAAGR